MAIPIWPGGLPQKLELAGFSETFPSISIETSMDAGPKKKRRKFTASVRDIAGQQIMTNAQVELLRTFYNDTTAGGSIRFDWVDPRDDSSVVEMRFKSPPKIQSFGGDAFQVQLALEILP